MSQETLQTTTQAEVSAPVQEARPVHKVQPVVDIVETKERYEIVANVPGVKREDIELKIEGDALHLSARGSAGNPKVKRPFDQLHYTRSFRLGRQIDKEQVDAELAHGVLRISLAKVQEAQPREIAVRVAEAAQN